MFNLVSKSTHAAALARAARAEHAVAEARLHLKKRNQDNERLFGSNMTLAKDNARLRTDLATTYVRDAKGRMARHPTATPVKLESVA